MGYKLIINKLFFATILFVYSVSCIATDELILRRAPGTNSNTSTYSYRLLTAALEATKPDYGPYLLRYADKEMSRPRTFSEMLNGEKVNIVGTPHTEEWSNNFIRIPIPIQRGILSYRLFLIHRDNVDLLKDVQNIEELKEIRIGSGSEWSITEILERHNFNVVRGTTKPSLIKMLDADRFSIYGRGINEIFGEFEHYAKFHPNLRIDEHLALYSYIPTYFHISPHFQRLAERVDRGLRIINANGEFQKLFNHHHAEAIANANLIDRRVIRLKDEAKEELYNKDFKFLYVTPGM